MSGKSPPEATSSRPAPLPTDYATSPLGDPAKPDPWDLDAIANQLKFFVDRPDYLRLAPTQDLVRFFDQTQKRLRKLNRDWEGDVDEYAKEVEQLEEKATCPRPADHEEHAECASLGVTVATLTIERDTAVSLNARWQNSLTKAINNWDKGALVQQTPASAATEVKELQSEIDWHFAGWADAAAALQNVDDDISPVPSDRGIVADFIDICGKIGKACISKQLAAMTQHLNFLPDAGDGVIPAIWNALPPDVRGSTRMPTSIAELNVFLANVTITPPGDPAPAGCDHPPELATALRMDAATPWNESIDMVNDLMTAAPAAPVAATTRSTLFKASEVPPFKDTAKYEEYRGQLKAFFESEDDPAPHEFGRALRRVVRGFEDNIAIQASQAWDVSPCFRHTWAATWQAFLLAMDQKFQKTTILEDTIGEFMRCRPKDTDSPSDFFNRFEAITNQRRVVEERQGIPAASRLSNESCTLRLLSILPRYLVDDVRLNLARRGQVIELMTPAQLRPEFERAWAYVPTPYKPPKGPAHPVPRGRNAPPPGRPTNATNEVKERTCGLIVSYDTAPAVPASLRGSLYSPQDPAAAARRSLAARMQVCEYCRRPRSEHHPSGPRFKPVTPANAAPVRRGLALPSPPPGPRIQDITDQQAIEPAPASSSA